MDCPGCGKRMEHEEYDGETGIAGGFFCEACDIYISDSEIDYSDELTYENP